MTAKLEKLWHRHKEAQNEIEELQRECQLEREVKLVSLTIDQFIPQSMYQKIVDRAHWDESSDEWVIHKIELAGNRRNAKRSKGMDDLIGPTLTNDMAGS